MYGLLGFQTSSQLLQNSLRNHDFFGVQVSDAVTSIIFEPLVPAVAAYKLRITTICQCRLLMK